MSIFKACDIRGKYGTDLTAEIAGPIGRAVGSELAGRTVVVGGDVRPSTGPLKESLIRGIESAGCRVLDVGILPTPAFYFAKDELRADGGVMVTGSHNPAGDNGFKISVGPDAITEEDLERIRMRVEKHDFTSSAGSCEACDVTERYNGFLRKHFTRRGLLKVVVDAGNGCYSRIAPDFMRGLGYDVVELFCEADGRFPNRSPNPAVASHLAVLCATVKREGAAVGVAYDGDGDRVVFVDEKGRVVESDVGLVLFARDVLRRGPTSVVYDIKCSGVVAEETRKGGGTPVMEKSGHSFIRGTLMRTGAALGGEISGHFFFGELGRDDGLYATLRMLEIVEADGRGLAAMADSVPRYAITPDLRLPCPPDRARGILTEAKRVFSSEKGCEVGTLDGVRVSWADGWALMRPSVTEPLLTLRFEARDAARLEEIQKMVGGRIPELGRLMASRESERPTSNPPSPRLRRTSIER